MVPEQDVLVGRHVVAPVGELVRRDGHWLHPDLKDVLSIDALTSDEEPVAEPVG